MKMTQQPIFPNIGESPVPVGDNFRFQQKTTDQRTNSVIMTDRPATNLKIGSKFINKKNNSKIRIAGYFVDDGYPDFEPNNHNVKAIYP